MSEEIYDVTIIGTGIAGYSAAMYSGRFNVKTLIIGEMDGGIITTTDIVENYPGYKSIGGFELAMKVKEHAQEYSVDMKSDRVVDVLKDKVSGIFTIKTMNGDKYTSKTIIFATGAKSRKLNIPGQEKLETKGVGYCALCDGAFFRGKRVAVVGGSDSAAKDALILTQFAEKVYIIYRKEKIRAEPINYDRVMKNEKIEIINNTNVTEFIGENVLTAVKLDKEYQGSNELALDGCFIAIGHIVQTELAKELGVKLNGKGEIIIDREAKTNISGVFAAGDCVDTVFKQAITGVGEAVLASYAAYEYSKRE